MEIWENLIPLFEESFLESYKDDYPCSDGRIGNIKYGPEKYECVSAFNRNPIGVYAIEDGEVEHIYDLTVQEATITTSFRHELCYRMKTALAENQPIKCAIDYISKGSHKDQGHAEDQSQVGSGFGHMYERW